MALAAMAVAVVGKVVLAVGLLAGALTSALLLVDPHHAALTPPCIFEAATDLNCPGCGGTRAAHSLLLGHWSQAWKENAFSLLIGPWLLVLLFVEAAKPPGWVSSARGPRPWLLVAFLASIILFTVLRNLPGWREYLSP